jgi:hypothetical protein
MRLLDGFRRGLQPIREAVTRALEKIEARYRRISHEIVHRELQRLPHHAVNDHAMRGRVDIGRAGMMPLEYESVRRNDPGLVLKRSHAPVRPVLAVDEHIGAAAHDVFLEL